MKPKFPNKLYSLFYIDFPQIRQIGIIFTRYLVFGVDLTNFVQGSKQIEVQETNSESNIKIQFCKIPNFSQQAQIDLGKKENARKLYLVRGNRRVESMAHLWTHEGEKRALGRDCRSRSCRSRRPYIPRHLDRVGCYSCYTRPSTRVPGRNAPYRNT